MREIRPSGSAGGAGQLNAPFLPRSNSSAGRRCFRGMRAGDLPAGRGWVP